MFAARVVFYHGFFCGDYNHGFSQNLGTDFHNIVMIRALFFVLSDYFGGAVDFSDVSDQSDQSDMSDELRWYPTFQVVLRCD